MNIPNITQGPIPSNFKDYIQFSIQNAVPFPASIYNLRVNTDIQEFFFDYDVFLRKYGFKHNYQFELDGIESNGLFFWKYGNITIVGRPDEDNDDILNYFRVIINDFPVLVSVDPLVEYFDTLIFRIVLPRYFPARIDRTFVSFDSIPAHPYVDPNTGIIENFPFSGEIDDIIWDIIQLLLFEPNRIIPDTRRDSDNLFKFTCNRDVMKWYLTQNVKSFYQKNIERYLNLLRS